MYPSFCPFRQPFGRFINNSVHSVGRFVVWIFPEYSSTVAGSCSADAPFQAVFDGLISWRNNRGLEWVMSSTIELKNAVVYDNADTGILSVTAINHQATNLQNVQNTFYNENTDSSIIDSIIVGDTGLSTSPVVAGEDGLTVMWDCGLRVRNITFINFPSSNTQAIFGPIIDGRCTVFCGGWTTRFSQLSFVNVQNRGNFRWVYNAVFIDEDGSLGNVAGSAIIAPDRLWNGSSACPPTPNFVNAITCPLSLGTWIRFAFNQVNLGQNGEVLNVYDTSNHHTVVLNLAKCLTHPKAYQPDLVDTISSTSLVTPSSTPLSSASNNGDWYYGNNTSVFTYIVKNPSTNTIPTDVSIELNVVKCRHPNCQPPAHPGLELPATQRPTPALYWSNDSDWSFATEGYGGSNEVKPVDNTNIYIPRGVWLVVDYPLPRILSLRIDGVLEFEQGINDTLYVDNILINGGQLIVVNVLLPNNAGSIGPRVIGVLGGLDLHGIPHNVSWTRLASTASAGQTSITLSEPVDWAIGNEIILTTTDTRIEHSERRTIDAINGPGTVITLNSALTYTHIVINNVFPNGEVYQVAGAIGLMTRNVRVICQSPASEKFGFHSLVTDYATNIWNPVGAEHLYTYYKGYARVSDTQFIGYGQFVDAPNEAKREGFHLYNLGDWSASRPTYIDSSSSDGDYYSAIGLWDTNGAPITNNVVYNTYESAIVIEGQNNIMQKNLVSTVYWSDVAQPEYAPFNSNWDGAIVSKTATSVDNSVSSVQRLSYRIQGNSCPGTILPTDIDNDYDNNEAHSYMSGVNIWPTDPGFQYDTTTTHIFGNNSMTIRNSLVIGAITPNDCSDVPDTTTRSEQYGSKAIPIVSAISSSGSPGGRSDISFPYFSRDNMMPVHPWSSIGAYPCIGGVLRITNVTFGFFNDICSRRDIAIQVSQDNDDGQHPVITSQISLYNISSGKKIFNGRPNIGVVDPSDCVGGQAHGVGDFRIPTVALSDSNGQIISISGPYPGRGIDRSPACVYQPSYQMYLCLNVTDYRMLIIESMDADTET
ncbi:unnamed protein product [Rotaria magnacalcarata]|uniref:G8 domain-containing protein n=1 Tax=Rotaria magnacalcarata TaxID=392030 RepID=A0A816VNM7_9BILA|nr:unnamed protein product [Rotaria magnacalcarata]CAF4107838.1 unnamed protein product [Rotaria magnacalcarata]